ncbi:hypothetical protein KMT30_08620 [Streptomyces sp. IBSBF 2953]|nr:hypothetical protein [Streptomyces hayashii]
MGASMLTATIAFPAGSTEPPNFDRGRQLLEKIEDPSLFTFDEPGTELEELLPDLDDESDLFDEKWPSTPVRRHSSRSPTTGSISPAGSPTATPPRT